MPRTTAHIARLNDELRTTFRGGLVLVTPTVESAPYRDDIFRAVREYQAFDRDNDPYGEHDFGSLELRDERYFWKIDPTPVYRTPRL